MLALLLLAIPIVSIAISCGGKKKDPATGAPPAGGGVPAGGEKTGENKTSLDGMSQTGATGGGTQA